MDDLVELIMKDNRIRAREGTEEATPALAVCKPQLMIATAEGRHPTRYHARSL